MREKAFYSGTNNMLYFSLVLRTSNISCEKLFGKGLVVASTTGIMLASPWSAPKRRKALSNGITYRTNANFIRWTGQGLC